MRFLKVTAFVIAAACMITSSANADIAIANADFEANGPGFVQATSWDGVQTARVADHASFRNESASFGGDLHFAFTQGTTGPAEQTLTTAFVEGDYTLAANVNYGSSDIGVDAVFDLGYDSGSGFVSVGPVTIDLAAFNDGTPANGTGWDVGAADFNVASGSAAIGQDIIIRINSSVTQGLWFDNVTLTAIPEPGSLALLGLGSIAMVWRRRK